MASSGISSVVGGGYSIPVPVNLLGKGRLSFGQAIVLQQLHYWLLKSGKKRDGHRWIYKTYRHWSEQDFPFWSERNVREVLTSLEESWVDPETGEVLPQLVYATDGYNQMRRDRTKWYRINYEHPWLKGSFEVTDKNVSPAEVEHLANSQAQPEADQLRCQESVSSVPETTQETTVASFGAKAPSDAANTVGASPSPSAPERALIGAYMETSGTPFPAAAGKAINMAKPLVKAGITPEDVRGCTRWLMGEKWYREKGFDWGTVVGKIDQWPGRGGSAPKAPPRNTRTPLPDFDPVAFLASEFNALDEGQLARLERGEELWQVLDESQRNHLRGELVQRRSRLDMIRTATNFV